MSHTSVDTTFTYLKDAIGVVLFVQLWLGGHDRPDVEQLPQRVTLDAVRLVLQQVPVPDAIPLVHRHTHDPVVLVFDRNHREPVLEVVAEAGLQARVRHRFGDLEAFEQRFLAVEMLPDEVHYVRIVLGLCQPDGKRSRDGLFGEKLRVR